MRFPEDIQGLCQALREGLRAALGDKLYGIYVYGAAAFAESEFTGDIDFHVILTEALTDAERRAINELHDALARDFPPLGAELDGYYILLEEAQHTSPPVHQLQPDITDESWALHREHMRAGRCLILHGPEPKQVYPPVTWAELESALWGELRYVQAHLDKYPDYCILNLCRLMYSFQTRDVVVSKAAAAEWAGSAFPQWRKHIEAAKRSYAGQATAEDRQWMNSEARRFFRFACERIGRVMTEEGHQTRQMASAHTTPMANPTATSSR
ncbi:MAG: DUF4111 domain-containing protein [Anaerolineae bacterium]|nr:DUF4111 domain-containing protein [Anaerolineae bacterium]